jgi:sugar lactone lactonase YvrE
MGLGGWSLSAHHGFNRATGAIYFGDGRRRHSDSEQNELHTVGGGQYSGEPLFEGQPATESNLGATEGIDVGPDGSIYFATTSHGNRVLRIAPDGILTTFAGSAMWGFAGDGGPATSAKLFTPSDVAVGPDGSVYIADSGNRRIRRVGPDGVITTVAGTGVAGLWSNGALASGSPLGSPVGIDVAADGARCTSWIGATGAWG